MEEGLHHVCWGGDLGVFVGSGVFGCVLGVGYLGVCWCEVGGIWVCVLGGGGGTVFVCVGGCWSVCLSGVN